ncbi:MAG: sialate O-acetylesterase, partial [Kiritimatiellae bacterium]|nr:sialate O-acetylesterase [Kiritimatiellia bacterium]
NAKGFREHGRRWAECILATFFPGVPTNAVRGASPGMSLLSPQPGHVAQRDAQNCADVPVSGNFEGALSRIEGRWTPMPGGDPSPWTLVADAPQDGYFSGKLPMTTGWYRLEFRGLKDGRPVAARTVERVGVGEVFVVIGGDSVANFGQSRQEAKDPRVSSYCTVCYERPMRDPLRGAIGDKGTSWPALGDALAGAFDVPVEIVVCGYSGAIAQWKPGTPMYNGGIMSTLFYSRRFATGGYRAILWEVGEMDAKLGVKADDFVGAMTSIVTQVSKEVGWQAPWVIAGVAYHPEAAETNRLAIREAQKRVCDGKILFEGPTADDLTGPVWRYDGIHFTEAGLQEHGKRWATVLLKLFLGEKR